MANAEETPEIWNFKDGMVYLVPFHLARYHFRSIGKKMPLRAMAAVNRSNGIMIIGRPTLWKRVVVEDFVPLLLEHETLHIVLPPDATSALDRKWPYGVPR